jgi:fatty-acyl-CoA synthase
MKKTKKTNTRAHPKQKASRKSSPKRVAKPAKKRKASLGAKTKSTPSTKDRPRPSAKSATGFKRKSAANKGQKKTLPRRGMASLEAPRAAHAALTGRPKRSGRGLPLPRKAPSKNHPQKIPKDPYESGLERNSANYRPLTPLSFLARAAEIHPEAMAIVHGRQRISYADFFSRSRRLASALSRLGIGKNDTVSVLLPNVPAMLEAHHAVPMTGAVLNAINTRLDPATIAFILDHAETKAFVIDKEFSQNASAALKLAKTKPHLIQYDDNEFQQHGEVEGAVDYAALLASGDPDFAWKMPGDEWDAISLNYTSGTTGNPKGVVCHHRGAALMGYANILACGMAARPVYLWTLPMFHCNGWCFPWTLALNAGTHVCLRRVRAKEMYELIANEQVTHLCGAPIVMAALLNAPANEKREFSHQVNFVHAAAPPPEAVLMAMLKAGFSLTHVYGLTETYGPATVNEWKPEWDGLSDEQIGAKRVRQGVSYAALERLTVMDPQTLEEVPADGITLGEVMFRGNIVMKGYFKNPAATQSAFTGGWFHSGDLGVLHPDGYIQLKDRSKDIIISGGENISSIEVEEALYKHPAVLFAAVVAKPDKKWGETPCAFVEKRPGFENLSEEELFCYCRSKITHFKCPKTIVFCELPKTTTGKIQKFKLREQAKALP